MESGYPKYRYADCHQLGFWVTVGTGPQCCNGETFGLPIKGYILYCKRLAFWAFQAIQLVRSSVVCQLTVILYCNNPQGLIDRERERMRVYCKKAIQRRDLGEKGSRLSAELPRTSLAAYAVQQNCVPLSSYNIETQFHGRNFHPGSEPRKNQSVMCLIHVIVFTCYICHSLHELCLQ